jgi:hypothetical protein
VYLILFATLRFEMDPFNDPYKNAKIIHYKALSKNNESAAQKWERKRCNIMMKHLGMTSNAILILTAERSARLNWLHRLYNLHGRTLHSRREANPNWWYRWWGIRDAGSYGQERTESKFHYLFLNKYVHTICPYHVPGLLL